jgi:hypothetical protein
MLCGRCGRCSDRGFVGRGLWLRGGSSGGVARLGSLGRSGLRSGRASASASGLVAVGLAQTAFGVLGLVLRVRK